MCSENHLHFDYVRLAWDSGFCFKESKTRNAFDLSTIGLVDLDKVTRDRDIATVEKHIPTLLQFPLDEELTKILEPTFVKVFKLCQLALQYLIFCNKYLDNTVVILKKDLSSSNEDNANFQKLADHLKVENDNLRMKNKDLKETFQGINQSASFKCQECPKVFNSENYLQAHIKRRHDSQSSQLQSESEKLQLEIKELKERLNSTEKYIHKEKISEKDEDSAPDNDAVLGNADVLQAKFDQLKEHIERELSSLRDEAFYRNIYEKWFDEMFQKLKHESPKKVFVEKGAGDFVQVAESSTQTCVDDEDFEVRPEVSAPQPMPRKINVDVKQINLDDLEVKMKNSADAQREMLEKVLEQKLAGSIEKLESQMNSFWNKMNIMEAKKQEDLYKTESKNRIIAQDPIVKPAQIIAHHNFTTTPKGSVTISSSETESDSEQQIQLRKPQPAQRIVHMVPRNDTIQQTFKRAISVPSFHKKGTVGSRSEEKIVKTLLSREKIVKTPVITDSSDVTSSDESSGADAVQLPKPVSKPSFVTVASRSNPSLSKGTNKNVPVPKTRSIKKFAEEQSQSSQGSTREDVEELQSSRTSTLAKRSLTRLTEECTKSATHDAEVLEGVRNELQDIFDLRLKEIGVAPQWKGLPQKTFKHASSVIEHQASLAKKNIPNYSKIRGEILKVVNKKIQEENKDNQKRKKSPRTRSNNLHGKNTNTMFGNIENEEESAQEVATKVTAFQNVSDPSSSESKVVQRKDNTKKQVLRENVTNLDNSGKGIPKIEQPITGRKKVLFNLDSDDSEAKSRNEAEDYSSSYNSSLLDEHKKKKKNDNGLVQKGDKENKANDGSDWDISDIH